MKGLFSVLGLIAALFISAAQASIYDAASVKSPDVDSTYSVQCLATYSGYYFNKDLGRFESPDECASALSSYYVAHVTDPSYADPTGTCEFNSPPDATSSTVYCFFTSSVQGETGQTRKSIGRWLNYIQESTKICPPQLYPSYTHGRDTDGDGEPDGCYNPNELDELSQCALAANGGVMLPFNGSTNGTVCESYSDGASCAFSLVAQGNTYYYAPNLEKSCFGNTQYPDYEEPNPPPTMPQDEQCQPYGGGFVCSADPDNYCSSGGICLDGCGYVNDQFVCFRDEECTGASCTPAPVDCTTSPDAPVCEKDKDTPTPSFCEQNPMVAGCQQGSTFCEQNPTAPSCNIVGGGGGGVPAEKFVLDYDKLINGMKDAAKLLIDEQETPDFKTTQDKIDEANDAYQQKLDDFNDSSMFSTIQDTISGNIFGTVDNMLPSGGSCSAFIWWGQSLDFCYAAEKVRTLLYFVFSFLTFIYLRDLFFSTVTPRKE